MNLYVVGVMGSGKTVFTTLYALIFSLLHPKAPIYSNYNLKLKNFIYTPTMCLPYSTLIKLKRGLILIDDIASLPNIDNFIMIMASMSRKLKLDIIITSQYYTMLNPKGRKLCHYEVNPTFDKNTNKMSCIFRDLDDYEFETNFKNVDKVFQLYDTNEIVLLTNERKVINEIMKHSKTIDDLENNLQMFFSTTKYNQYYKKLSKEFD